jgi:uncharacterized protein YceK
MRSLVLVIAVAVMCSGCMATPSHFSGAKLGDGNVKRTQFIEI